MTAKQTQPKIRSAALTDVGMRRDHNEDSVLEHSPLFGVADGVGGAASGEDASRLALDTIAASSDDLARTSGAQEVEVLLAEVIDHANSRVFDSQLKNPEQAGMATTLTIAVVSGPQVSIGHVGDSRAYRISADGVIEQITDDHSVVGEMVRQGQIDADEAAVHPQRNVITRALGTEPSVIADVLTVFARGGDIFLLCSDGLTGHVRDPEIVAIVGKHSGNLDAAAKALIDAANASGGSDNISAVLFEPLAGTHLHPGELSGELSIAPMQPPTGTGPQPAVKKRKQAPPRVIETLDDVPEPELTPLHARRRPQRKKGNRSVVKLLVALSLFVAVALVGILVWNNSYFLVERKDGRIGIDHGIPAFGLHVAYKTSKVQASDLSGFDRENLLGEKNIRSYDSATQTLEQLEVQTATVEAATPRAG